MRVGVHDGPFGVLGSQGDDRLVQLLVVGVGDGVEVAEAAVLVVLGLGAAVEGEHGGDASERGQVDHHHRVRGGHVERGLAGGGDVQRGGEDFLQAHDIIHGVSSDVIRLRKSLGRQTERTLRAREVQ